MTTSAVVLQLSFRILKLTWYYLCQLEWFQVDSVHRVRVWFHVYILWSSSAYICLLTALNPEWLDSIRILKCNRDYTDLSFLILFLSHHITPKTVLNDVSPRCWCHGSSSAMMSFCACTQLSQGYKKLYIPGIEVKNHISFGIKLFISWTCLCYISDKYLSCQPFFQLTRQEWFMRDLRMQRLQCMVKWLYRRGHDGIGHCIELQLRQIVEQWHEW